MQSSYNIRMFTNPKSFGKINRPPFNQYAATGNNRFTLSAEQRNKQRQYARSKEAGPAKTSYQENRESNGYQCDSIKKFMRTSSENQLINNKNKNDFKRHCFKRSKSFYEVEALPQSSLRPKQAWPKRTLSDAGENDGDVAPLSENQLQPPGEIVVAHKRNVHLKRTSNPSSKARHSIFNMNLKSAHEKRTKLYEIPNVKEGKLPGTNKSTGNIFSTMTHPENMKSGFRHTYPNVGTKDIQKHSESDLRSFQNLSLSNSQLSHTTRRKQTLKAENSNDNSFVSHRCVLDESDMQIYTFTNPSFTLKLNSKNSLFEKTSSEFSTNSSNSSQFSKTHSLDSDNRPKYSGYKPKNGVCFVSFKSMFRKPARILEEEKANSGSDGSEAVTFKCPSERSFLKSEKENHEESEVLSSNYKTSWDSHNTSLSRSLENIPMTVTNTVSHLNGEEKDIITKTRQELKHRIMSAREPKFSRNHDTKKIHLNIFLQDKVNKYKSSSLETNMSTDEENGSFEKVDKSDDQNSHRTFPQSAVETSESLQIYGPQNDQNKAEHKEVFVNDCETLATGEESQSTSEIFTYLCNPPEKRTEDGSNEKPKSKNNGSARPNFLKTLILENEKNSSRKIKHKRNNARVEVNIETEYGIQNRRNESILQGRIKPFQKTSKENSPDQETLKTNKVQPPPHPIPVASSVPDKDPVHTQIKVDVQSRLPNHSESDMQAFRKKLEESLELHRRLHFCDVKVSKETVMRALMSPFQIRIYHELHNCG